MSSIIQNYTAIQTIVCCTTVMFVCYVMCLSMRVLTRVSLHYTARKHWIMIQHSTTVHIHCWAGPGLA